MTGIEIMMLVVGVLFITSVYIGYINALEMSVFIEVNTFTTSYYNIGISYEYKDFDSLYRIDQLTIGLFFFNINFCFLKDIDA